MIPIFISSTFTDMGSERDMLHNKVLPLLSPIADECGEYITLADLRWGIDTTDAKNKMEKVLSVCLDVIDNCNPYFISFIGSRYGSVPALDAMKPIAKRHNINLYEPVSITELEIIYGALLDTAKRENCFFYFRKDIDCTNMPDEYAKIYQPAQENRVNQLKAKIKSIYGNDHVFEYEAEWCENRLAISDDLTNRIVFNVGEMIRKKHIQGINTPSFQSIGERMESYARNFPFADGDKSKICNKVFQELSQNRFVNVYGATRYLNNCFIAQAINVAKQKYGNKVTCYFCDNTASGGSGKKQFVNYVRDWVDSLGNDTGYLFVGNIDLIYSCEEISDKDFFINKLNKKIQLVLTNCDELNSTLFSNLEIPKFSRQERIKFIRSMMKSNFKNDDYGLAKVLCEKNSSEDPIYLKHALDVLFHLESNELKHLHNDREIRSFIREKAKDIPDSLDHLLLEYVLKPAPENIKQAMRYIDASHNGLRLEDLKALLEEDGLSLTNLDWQSFYTQMEGRIYANAEGHIFKTLSRYEGDPDWDIKDYQKRLFSYISTLDENDSVYKHNYIYLLFGQEGYEEEKLRILEKLYKSTKNQEELDNDNSIHQFYHFLQEEPPRLSKAVLIKCFALVQLMSECDLEHFIGEIKIEELLWPVYHGAYSEFYHLAEKLCTEDSFAHLLSQISFDYCHFRLRYEAVTDSDDIILHDYDRKICDKAITSLRKAYSNTSTLDSFNNVIEGYNQYITLCCNQYIFCRDYETVGEEEASALEQECIKFIQNAPFEYQQSSLAVETLKDIQQRVDERIEQQEFERSLKEPSKAATVDLNDLSLSHHDNESRPKVYFFTADNDSLSDCMKSILSKPTLSHKHRRKKR